MFKKIFTLLFGLLMFAFLMSNIAEAQTTKKTGQVYPVFSISPMGGVNFPVGSLNDSYSPSFNVGLDLNLQINRETSFFLYGGYHDMPFKTDFLTGGDASMIAITAGPRYVFTTKSIKAQIFMEAGIGAYLFNTKEFTIPGPPSVLVQSDSKANFGVNLGPGARIPLGKVVDLILKTKVHYIFAESAQTFITAVAGLDFRL